MVTDMMADLHPLAIAKLQMKPGDVLVVQCLLEPTLEMAKAIEEYVKRCLPDGTPVMIVGPGLELAVVTPPKEPA